jgi:hypothetical protein
MEIAAMKKIVLFSAALLCLCVISGVWALGQSAKDFEALLIDIQGWKGDKPETVDMTVQDMRGITVSRNYSQNEKSLKAGIIIGQQTTGMWNPGYQEGMRIEAGGNLMEVKILNGYLVLHTYNQDEKAGMMVVLLQEVAPDGGSGAVFLLAYNEVDDSTGVELSQKFDWDTMKAKVKNI